MPTKVTLRPYVPQFTPRRCEHCGRDFLARTPDVERGYGRYCSNPCRYAGRRVPIGDRLNAHRDTSGGPLACWPYIGSRHLFGYGKIFDGWKKPPRDAHRVAWELAYGPIPEGLHVCHRCNNPPCCNPAHLYLDTRDGNMAFARELGRSKAPPPTRGIRNTNAIFTDEDVRLIRRAYAAGASQSEIARCYRTQHQYIHSIVHRKTWKHVS